MMETLLTVLVALPLAGWITAKVVAREWFRAKMRHHKQVCEMYEGS